MNPVSTIPRNYHAPPDSLKDRVILVTGSGRGIGRVAATTFAAHGATIVLHGRNVANLESVYDEIVAQDFPQPVIYVLDLEQASSKDYAELARAIENNFGRLDGILHNAVTPYTPTPLENQGLEMWQQLLTVNLIAPFALTRSCLPLLKTSKDACVLVTSETHGHTPSAYWGGFAIAKQGLEAWVAIQAQEWSGLPNLRINAVVPGAVQSPHRVRTHPAESKNSLPTPEFLMPIYLYLMGPDSKGVSGRVIACQEN